jgi:DNA-binding response OmpR family regulator
MKRALVIDDDTDVGSAIKSFLAVQRYESFVASRASEGIRALVELQFDFAIVDLFLPGISGFDTIEVIRLMRPVMPIIAMTGLRIRPRNDPDLDYLKLATDLGATSCIRKPFSPQQLQQLIEPNPARSPA